VLSDNAAGEFAGTEVFSDLDIAHIEHIADSAPHREVDLAVVAADKEGVVSLIFNTFFR
jgi:hypothetical protein